jgi:hypothetical protein
MASEDSVHSVCSLTAAVHPLAESKNRTAIRVRYDRLEKQPNCSAPQLEVGRLRAYERKPLEEGHDALPLVREAVHLPIPAAVAGATHRPASQGLPKQIEWLPIVLGDVEGRRDPEAPRRARSLAAHDHEAPLSQREPGEEPTDRGGNRLYGRPFLLIACTRHIVTVPARVDGTSSAGYSGVPAYSQLLQLPRSTDSYGRRLPGLGFGASPPEGG